MSPVKTNTIFGIVYYRGHFHSLQRVGYEGKGMNLNLRHSLVFTRTDCWP